MKLSLPLDGLIGPSTKTLRLALHTPESTMSSPQTTTFQEYVDPGVDLIGLPSLNVDSPNSSNLKDESALQALCGSGLEDLDWILEGFRVNNVLNAFESVNNFIPPLGNLSLVPPYDWAPVSEVGPDLITFDSAHDLGYGSAGTALPLVTAHRGSFEPPSFKSWDDVQTESNRLF